MDDFPKKIADLLEEIATRVRSMTVDRVAIGVRWTAAGVVLAMIGATMVLFLLIGLFRVIGEAIGYEVAYAVLGAIFLFGGALLLRQRRTSEKDVTDNA